MEDKNKKLGYKNLILPLFILLVFILIMSIVINKQVEENNIIMNGTDVSKIELEYNNTKSMFDVETPLSNMSSVVSIVENETLINEENVLNLSAVDVNLTVE